MQRMLPFGSTDYVGIDIVPRSSSIMAIGSLATEVSVDLLLTRLSPVLSPIRSVTALVDLSLGVVRPRDGRCPWRTTSLRALFREEPWCTLGGYPSYV